MTTTTTYTAASLKENLKKLPIIIVADSARHLPDKVPQLGQVVPPGRRRRRRIDGAHSVRIAGVDDVTRGQTTIERKNAGRVEDFHRRNVILQRRSISVNELKRERTYTGRGRPASQCHYSI